MVYLEYNPDDKNHVEKIHDTNLANISAGNLLAQSEEFKIGDEFEFYIVINEVKDGLVTSWATVRQAPQAKYVLEQLAQGKTEITDIKSRIQPLETKVIGLELASKI